MQQFHKFHLTFMCGSTCFGRLSAHLQEHTTALGASGFTVGEKRLGALLVVVYVVTPRYMKAEQNCTSCRF